MFRHSLVYWYFVCCSCVRGIETRDDGSKRGSGKTQTFGRVFCFSFSWFGDMIGGCMLCSVFSWWLEWLCYWMHDDAEAWLHDCFTTDPCVYTSVCCVCLSVFGDADQIDRKQLFSLTTTDSGIQYISAASTRYLFIFDLVFPQLSVQFFPQNRMPVLCLSLCCSTKREGKLFLSSSSLRVMLSCSSSQNHLVSSDARHDCCFRIAFSFHFPEKTALLMPSSCHQLLQVLLLQSYCNVTLCSSTCGWEMSVWQATWRLEKEGNKQQQRTKMTISRIWWTCCIRFFFFRFSSVDHLPSSLI